MSDGGKGSAQRPIVDWAKFEKSWDEIFGKPLRKPPVSTTGSGVFVVNKYGVCDKKKEDK